MGIFSQFRALLRKNLILWRRNCCGSLCEIICPCLLMGFLLSFKYAESFYEAVDETSYIQKKGDSYFMDETIYAGDTTRDDIQLGLFAANPFQSCISLNRPIIAFVGSDNFLYEKIQETLLSKDGSIFNKITF